MKKETKYLLGGLIAGAVGYAGVKYLLTKTEIGQTVCSTVKSGINQVTGIFRIASNAAEQAIEQAHEEKSE